MANSDHEEVRGCDGCVAGGFGLWWWFGHHLGSNDGCPCSNSGADHNCSADNNGRRDDCGTDNNGRRDDDCGTDCGADYYDGACNDCGSDHSRANHDHGTGHDHGFNQLVRIR